MVIFRFSLTPYPIMVAMMMSSEMGKKIDKVIKGFERLEKAMVAKENNLENLIEEKVEKYLNEQRDKNDRHSNLIFHNIPESDEVDILTENNMMLIKS